MIRIALVLLVAGIGASQFLDDREKLPKGLAAYDDTQSSETEQNGRVMYRVVASSGSSCRLTSIAAAQGHVRVETEPECGAVHAGLDTVRQWTPDSQGNVLLNDADGKTVLMIQSSDGFAYEAALGEAVQISFQTTAN